MLDMTSFMAVLHDISIKTGIKITIHGGISDKYVTLNTEKLPIDRIGDLLDELSLNNTALLYDQNGNISEIIILPEGTAMPRIPQAQARRRRYR